jgi:hypothetical protein
MNFLFNKGNAVGSPGVLPASYFEAPGKIEVKTDKKATKKPKIAIKPSEETPGVQSLIDSNPSKKQVIEYFKSRIESYKV